MSKDQSTPANSGARSSPERAAVSSAGASGANSGGAPTAGDGFLSSLADLESRINVIKQAHEQAAARDVDLSGKEAAMANREEDLADRERSVAGRVVKAEAELTRAQRELAEAEGARSEAADALRQLAAQREQGEEHRAAFEQERTAFADEQQRLEQERQELEFDVKGQREELERDRASVAEHARTLAEQMKRSDDENNAAIWSNRLEAIQIQLGESNGSRARLETELSQSREDIGSLTQELIEANQNKGVPREEVQKREKVIADLSARLDETQATTTMLQQQVEQSATVLQAAEKRARESAERERSVKDALARAAEAEGQLSTTAGELGEATKLLATRERELAESARSLKERVDRAAAASLEAESLKTELTAARELLDQAEAAARASVSADEVRSRDAAIAGLERALKEAERTSADLARQQRESDETRIAELSARLSAAERASAGSVSAEELVARDRTIAELRAQLDDAIRQATRPQSPSGPDEETLGELAKRDEAIAILRERLDEAVATGSRSGGTSGDAAERGPTEEDFRRRDRLRRYKSMLQSQARKIVAAQSAIQRRHADCEVILQNRAKLAQLAHQLARAEKKITASKARSGAGAAVLYLAATLGIIAVMSWEVSKRVWPGTYIARAVLEADVGRRIPKPEDLAAWQKDHGEMLSDPRLMEVAAQRMSQRGLTLLGTPGELASRLRQDMYVQSSKPGSLTVELRGEGAEKTALVLDTVVTAFKSVADQARDERTNDMGVTIAQAAAAGNEPLFDKRLEKAGGVFGGAALAAGLAGLIIWSRLVKAKKKFDQAAAVDAALGEVDWAKLEASIKQNAAQKT